jgi:phosphatidylserine synthase
MENNATGNASAAQNPEERKYTYRDWREARREYRQEMRESRHRWPFHGVFLGLTLVLLGVLFLLNQAGTITGDTWWQSLLIGLGAISILNGIAHYRSRVFRWGSFGKFIVGIILILVGVFFMIGISEWWPVVLIVAGVAFMLRFFWRR